MSSVLVTGCSSGFGELIARTLAANGHHVFATMRATTTRNAEAAQRLQAWATEQGTDLHVLELDVTDDPRPSTARPRRTLPGNQVGG